MISPEQRLWLAVITQHIADYRKGAGHDYHKAKDFLFNGSREFHKICQAAGIDGDYLVRKLKDKEMMEFAKRMTPEQNRLFWKQANTEKPDYKKISEEFGLSYKAIISKRARIRQKLAKRKRT